MCVFILYIAYLYYFNIIFFVKARDDEKIRQARLIKEAEDGKKRQEEDAKRRDVERLAQMKADMEREEAKKLADKILELKGKSKASVSNKMNFLVVFFLIY